MNPTSDNIRICYIWTTEADADGKRVPVKGAPPVGCVALHRDEQGNIARGISICSIRDNWNYKKGANKAIARCRHAMACQCTDLPIDRPIPISDPERLARYRGSNADDIIGGELRRRSAARFLAAWVDSNPGEITPNFKSSWNPPLTKRELAVLDYAATVRGAHPGVPVTAACSEG